VVTKQLKKTELIVIKSVLMQALFDGEEHAFLMIFVRLLIRNRFVSLLFASRFARS